MRYFQWGATYIQNRQDYRASEQMWGLVEWLTKPASVHGLGLMFHKKGYANQ